MATTVPLGAPTDVTLAGSLAVETLTLPGSQEWLILWETSGVDIYIVTLSGGTAATNGRLVPAASISGGYPFNIKGYGYVGLAGSAAGTITVEVR